MTPYNNTDLDLSVYADWLEDAGSCLQADEIRDDLSNPQVVQWDVLYKTNGVGGGDAGGVGPLYHAGYRHEIYTNVGCGIVGRIVGISFHNCGDHPSRAGSRCCAGIAEEITVRGYGDEGERG